MTHSITMFKGLDVDVEALKAARRSEAGPGNPFGPFNVARKNRSAETKYGIIGNGDGLFFIPGLKEHRHRAEEFFVVSWHARPDIG